MIDYIKENQILLDVNMFEDDSELRDALMTELGLD
jgi:hypothetical protein